MEHYENVNVMAADDGQEDAKDEKMVESVCLAHCASDEMSCYHKVSVSTIEDGEAKPKILTEPVYLVPKAADEMKMSLNKTSVLTTEDGAADETYEEIDQNVNNYYIRQRYHRKYAKFACTTIGIIIIVVFITLLAVPFKRDSSTKPSVTMVDFRGKLVILSNKTRLLMVDPKTKNTTVIFNTTHEAKRFDIGIDRRIYWLEGTDFPLPERAQLKVLANGRTSVLMSNERFKPRAMALDHVSENLYAVDMAAGNLVVVSIRTGEYALLMTRLHGSDIVLDPEEGLLFILDGVLGPIIRARMDGTEIITVVRAYIFSLTLDTKSKRLYWTQNYAEIKSSDYEGNHRQTFFKGVFFSYRLAILDDRLYGYLLEYGYPPNLFSCKISVNHTCEKYENYMATNFGNPNYVKGYSSTRGMSVKNPCEPDNGGCQQLCLLAGRNARSCACRMGWQLNEDKRTCHEVRDFVVYIHRGFVQVNGVDGAANDLVWPTPYKIDTIARKGQIDFDYDMKNDDFYWSDDIHIYKMKLKKFDGNTTIILSVNEPNTTLGEIAYDWFTGNMYFVQRHSDRSSLMLFNVNLGEKHRKTLMTYYYKETSTPHACPYALTLHPAEGSMFYACWGFIQRATMNNTSVSQTHSSFPEFEQEHRLVAVDYAKDRVYWIWHSDLVTMIKHSKFDGSDVRVISVNDVKNGRTIDVHERWLYIGNLTSIWRVDKETGKGAVKIPSNADDKGYIDGFKVVSEKVHMSDDGNNCAEGNGGCQQFCLNGKNGPICMCQDDMIARGFTCSRD